MSLEDKIGRNIGRFFGVILFVFIGFSIITTLGMMSEEFEVQEEVTEDSFSIVRPTDDFNWDDGQLLQNMSYNDSDNSVYLEEGYQGVYREDYEFDQTLSNLSVVNLKANISDFDDSQNLTFVVFDSDENDWVEINTPISEIEDQNETLEINESQIESFDFGNIEDDGIIYEIKIDGENVGDEATVEDVEIDFEHDEIVTQEGEDRTLLHSLGFLILVIGGLVGLLIFLYNVVNHKY